MKGLIVIDTQNWHDKQYAEALRLFKIVMGEGDCGSEIEFKMLYPTEQSGWLRLAADLIKAQEYFSKWGINRSSNWTDGFPEHGTDGWYWMLRDRGEPEIVRVKTQRAYGNRKCARLGNGILLPVDELGPVQFSNQPIQLPQEP